MSVISNSFTVTKAELAALKKFQKELDEYNKLVIRVFRTRNGQLHDSEEVYNLINKEKISRRKINSLFGKVEQLTYNLIGGKPFMQIPAIPGHQWDIFAEAFSSKFTSTKGDCLEMAIDSVDRAVGKAEGLVSSHASATVKVVMGDEVMMFEDELVNNISDQKIKTLCLEFNNVFSKNSNAGALLFRTILLLTLQHKLGIKAKDELSEVLGQAVSGDVYDKHVTRLLKQLQGIPKTLLDASHHSKWIMIKGQDLNVWAQALRQVLLATFN